MIWPCRYPRTRRAAPPGPSTLILGLALVGAAATIAHANHGQETLALVAKADALWIKRSEGANGPQAAPKLVRQIVAAYEAALADQPNSLELQWKLLRALHFQGDFALEDGDQSLAHYEHARAIADEARQQLAIQVGKPLADMEPPEIAGVLAGVPEAAPVYLYSAILWGRWGENTGKMKAARQGVAGKLRDFAEVVILIDERWDSAGGHRFLGRIHTEAPKIPFVTGWIDRRLAVSELEQAVTLAPDEPNNLLFLADALLRFQSERRGEALDLLADILSRPPRPGHLVEDRAARADARELLAKAER